MSEQPGKGPTGGNIHFFIATEGRAGPLPRGSGKRVWRALKREPQKKQPQWLLFLWNVRPTG